MPPAAAFPQRDDTRLAVLETNHENLRARLYGSEGQKGDIQQINDKLDTVVTWQQRCVGAAALVTLVIPVIEHYWK
jgi:hypothetical protein